MNINFLRNRFEILEEQENDNINIFLLSETTIDSPFSVGKFMIKCYCTSYRLNRIYVQFRMNTFLESLCRYVEINLILTK